MRTNTPRSVWRRPELHAAIGVLVVALLLLGISAGHDVAGKTVSASAPAPRDGAVPSVLGNVLDAPSGARGSTRSGHATVKGARPKTPKVSGGSTGGSPAPATSGRSPDVTLPTIAVPGAGGISVTCRDGGPMVTITAIGIGTASLSIHNTRSLAITVDLGGLGLNSLLGVLHITGTQLVPLGPGATQAITVPLTGIPLNVIEGPLWAFTNGAACP